MRAGKTWGDPATSKSQDPIELSVGELPFDGTTTLTLAATGGSGTGAFNYVVVSGPCEIDGDELIATGLGTCVVKAVKAGDDEYGQAESEETIFTAVAAELEPQTPGDSELTVSGQPVEVTVEKSQDDSGLSVTGPDFTMSLAGTDGQGNPLGVTPDSALILEQTRMAEVSGTGFQGDSEVELYLHSTPLSLGTLTVDANGVFSGTVVIPKSVAAGIHHLQAVGYTADGAVRVLTLKVLLRALASTKVKTSAVIDFKIGSALLTKAAKAKLRVVAKLLSGSKSNTIKIVGSVQRSKSDYNNRTLSRARARAVKAFLLKIGVRGKFTIVIDDSVWASAKSRKAVLTANYAG
jgi:outer membrane protein OmpA-like peptidoglycan-associated protein